MVSPSTSMAAPRTPLTTRGRPTAAPLRILDVLPEQPELGPRRAEQRHEERQRQGARVAKLQELPRRLVDAVDEHVRGVQRPAVREHVDEREELERGDDPGDEQEQRHRREKWK